MHIHSNPMVSQMQGLNGTQGAQQAAAVRREAMAVRKKLTDFAAVTDDNEGVSRITYDSNGESESGSRRNRDPQSEEESFKSIYFSLKFEHKVPVSKRFHRLTAIGEVTIGEMLPPLADRFFAVEATQRLLPFPGFRMTAPASGKNSRNLLKTIPGLLISAFFLWYTFRGISFAQIRALRPVHPIWIVGVLAFTAAGYTLRCVRWTRMMRPTGARFAVCARVLMTSLAANNILPLRIGDVMRIFTYAGDLGTSPSVILSTVILEKLLDIFVLVLMFVSTVGSIATPRLRLIANISLAVSAIGLLVLLVGSRKLQQPVRRLFARLPANSKLAKVEHWITLALDATSRLGVTGSLLLLVQSVIIWICEGMIFVSAIFLVGIPVDRIGPWLAVSFANLSYLIPSSPGAIGPFELAVKTSLVSHGASVGQSAVFGLAIHAWMLVSVTGAGGIIFLLHRFLVQNHKPLLKEIEELPVELP